MVGWGGCRSGCDAGQVMFIDGALRAPSLGPASEWSPARLGWATGRPRGGFLRKWADVAQAQPRSEARRKRSWDARERARGQRSL